MNGLLVTIAAAGSVAFVAIIPWATAAIARRGGKDLGSWIIGLGLIVVGAVDALMIVSAAGAL